MSGFIFEALLQLGSNSLILFTSVQEDQYIFTAQKSLESVVVNELDTGEGLRLDSHVF